MSKKIVIITAPPPPRLIPRSDYSVRIGHQGLPDHPLHGSQRPYIVYGLRALTVVNRRCMPCTPHAVKGRSIKKGVYPAYSLGTLWYRLATNFEIPYSAISPVIKQIRVTKATLTAQGAKNSGVK
ncbi:MAG: hypothetical protein ABFS45_13690 [Pseudomonadota bacterium]